MTAGDSIHYAWEGDQLSVVGAHLANSVFTRFLTEDIQTGKADQDNDGRIKHDELYEYVSKQMKQIFPKQFPSLWTQGGLPIMIARKSQLEAAESTPKDPYFNPAEQTNSQKDSQLDRRPEINVLNSKLKGLWDQLEVHVSNLNRLELEKARFGGHLVPLLLETSIIELKKEILDIETQIQNTKVRLESIKSD